MIDCRTPLLRLLLVALVAAPLAVGWPGDVRATIVTISRDVGGTDYRPAIAESPDGGRLAAIWTQDLSVRSATSVDGGANWSDEVELATYVGVYVDHPRVAFDAAGNLHAVWMAGLGEERIVHHRAVPAGADPARRSDWRTGDSACTDCVEPDLAAGADGAIYVIYRDRGASGERLGIRRQYGVGDGWERGARFVAAAGAGDLAVTPDGKLHVVYSTPDSGVFYTRYTSYDAFDREDLQRVSTAGRANLPPAVAGDGRGYAHLVWIQESGPNRRTVFYREFDGGGLSAAQPVSTVVSARGDVHQWVDVVASAGFDIYATWTGFEENSRGTVYQNRRQGGDWSDPANLAALRVTPPSLPSRQSRFGLSSRGTVLLGFAARTSPLMVSSFLLVDAEAPSQPPAEPPPATPPAAPPAEPPSLGGDCLAFAETGQSVCGPFQAYWRQRGGLTLFGLPISDLRYEPNPDDGQTYIVQYFERARFEYHPGLAPDDVLLGLLGRWAARGRESEPPFQPVPDPGDGSWFPETGHTLRDGFRAYWTANGGLAVFGFPISEPFQERNADDGQVYTVQYFERNRFEHHPELAGTPYEILLGQLGRQALGGP